METRTASEVDRDEWEDRWRKFLKIDVKLDKLSELLTGLTLDSFLSQNSGLLQAVLTKCAGIKGWTSPKGFFVDELFKRRNTIVHRGQINFPQADAEMCFTIATTLTRILDELDAQRLRILDAKHRSQQTAELGQ